MYFTSFLENGKLTIALTGEIDHHCAKAYIQIISSKIEAYMPDVCVLDFHDVTFVDSSGIAVVSTHCGICPRLKESCCSPASPPSLCGCFGHRG